jgi:TPP-dependent pyruvate/acetoin dehydrogenase alpha subunit
MKLETASVARNGSREAEPAQAGEALTREDRALLLRYMLLMRTSEERGLTLYRQGKVPGSFYDGNGQEAISVGASFVLGPRDRMCILHRDLGAHFVRGVTPDRYLANYMGRSGGVTGGKDGNMHFGDPQLGCVGMVSMLPDMAQVACGLAMAFKLRGEPRVAMTFFGEGSTANGQWHEAMNFAGVYRLPAVFLLENNKFAYSTPQELEFAVDPIERAAGYGFPGVSVDGNDVEAVFEAAREAADRARDGGGPTLIECHTMRMHGHGAHDDMSYVPEELFREWSERDPIERYEARLSADHGFSSDELADIRADVEREVAEAAEKALASPMPEPGIATDGVFADAFEPLGDGKAPWSRWAQEPAGDERSAA